MASKKKPGKNTVKKSSPKPSARKPVAAARKTPTTSAKRPVAPRKVVKTAKPVKAVKPVVKKPAATPKKAEIKVGSAVSTARIAAVVAAKPGRNGKNAAGLSVKELAYFRDLLLAKRRELVGDVSSMEDEALRNSGESNLSTLPIHMADMGTDNYEQEFTLGLVEKDRNLLRDIQSALAKMVAGTYGICEGTGKPISKPRLEAQPWARYSIEHARTLEQRRMRA